MTVDKLRGLWVNDFQFEPESSAFNTTDESGFVPVYDQLVGNETCDPFEDSAEAVDAFRDGEWESLLLHNLADIQRTRELAGLAGRYVAKSDFKMKNLEPPSK